MSLIHPLLCCDLASPGEQEHGVEGHDKCTFLQARHEAMGISSGCNGFPRSFPVTHWLTHRKLLGIISLLWQPESGVRMASSKCGVSEGMQSQGSQCQLPCSAEDSSLACRKVHLPCPPLLQHYFLVSRSDLSSYRLFTYSIYKFWSLDT